MKKHIQADLLADVVSVYDQTKTTISGRAQSKLIDGDTALGPPLNRFLDVQTDSAVTPTINGYVMTENGRMFVLGAENAGLIPILLYSINYNTGAYSYIGRINVSSPDVAATTTTIRFVKVIDNGTTGWKIFFGTTGSILINGGSLLANNISLSDFVPIGFPNIPFANGNDQKAVYFMQDSSTLGVSHLQTATVGAVLDKSANRLYCHNGSAAVHQYYVYDTSVAPTYSTSAITGTAATDLINHAGHTFLDNDPIVFPSLTGGAGLTVGTTYFVRSSVAGVSYQVSATTGGAAINFTTDISAGTVGRAFGTSTSNFLHKTGNLPALTGLLLATDSEDFAQPQHTTNAGFDCAFFPTASNIYLGRLSELTAGVTSWPSLVTSNILGTPNQIVAPVATYAAWSNALDRAIVSTGLVFIMKQVVNNSIDRIFGGNNNKYFEGLVNPQVVEFQPNSAITSMDLEQGWLGVTNSSTGQRGVMLTDLRSDSLFDYSHIVTKVLNTPRSIYKFITTVDKLFDYTGSLQIYYRTSGFGSISGGWIEIPFAQLLDGFTPGEQVQFKISFATLGLDTSIPAQLCDFFLGYETQDDTSDNWELSVDDSSNGNPSITAFRLKEAYPSSVPALNYRAYDLSNVLLINHTTTGNAARFEYSTNDGVTWLSLGTIPNTVGTLVRYTFLTSPGVDIRPSLREA